jgi:purine-binding chemotaxis protein CheW
MSAQASFLPADPPPPATAADAEYLTFTLGDEHYAIDILAVREIRAFDTVTRIAGAPEFILGVMNLRGVIVPVVDLRLRFGVGSAELTPLTVLIVLQFGRRLVGVVVDGVADVVSLPAREISPAPEFAAVVGARHIRGLAPAGAQMLIVLDIEGLMLAPEMSLVDDAAERQ